MSYNLKEAPSQKGKIAVVTGANTGLGLQTSMGLARKGATVVLACRDMQKAEKAKDTIAREVPGASLETMEIDLGHLQSVRDFAEVFKAKYDKLDLLIENAGIMIPPFSKTDDGFESQMGVNYFGHFLLTNLLFPRIKAAPGARIVTLSSKAHENGKIDFDNLHAEKGYSKFGAYNQSKLACLMFAMELQRRLEGAGLDAIAVSAHPGVSDTELGRHVPKWLYTVLTPVLSLLTHPPERAALPTLYATTGSDVRGGEYFGPTGFQGIKGDPGKVKPEPHAYDKETAKKLWAVSEKLTGQPFDISKN